MTDIRVVHHGGMCCGIKTVHNLGSFHHGYDDPYVPGGKSGMCAARKAGFDKDQKDGYDETIVSSPDYEDADIDYEVVNSWTTIFDEEAPEETPRQRLDRIIQWIGKRRPSHMVEVCLQLDGTGHQQAWTTELEDIGFRLVTEFNNSNSGNKVGVYHLVLQSGKVVKK